MRLLAAVDSSVGVEAARGRKALLADVAHMRPFSGVRPQMTVEQRRSVKAFAAKFARQHLFRRGPLVSRGRVIIGLSRRH